MTTICNEEITTVDVLNKSESINKKIYQDIILSIEKNFQFQIENFNVEDISDFLCNINKCKGIIYTIGVGKSGNLAKHFSDLLKSISIKTFNMEPLNLLHGDLGCISDKDIIIFFSKSGNTSELLTVSHYLRERKCTIIQLCCEKKSLLSKICSHTIVLPFLSEIEGDINDIPTNSCMSQLIFINIIVSLLKQNIKVSQYKKNHPAGSISKKLKKIKDVPIYNFPKLKLIKNCELNTVLLEMTKYNIGCCFFTDENDNCIGLITDGDIRRGLIDNTIIPVTKDTINKKFYFETNIEKYVSHCKDIGYIPILKNSKIIFIINTYN